MPTPSERLREMNLELPPVMKPVGSYTPAVRHGDLLFLSGQIPVQGGNVVYTGPVGALSSLKDAQHAAALATLNAIAVAADAAGGIDRVKRVVKLVVYVASAPGFCDQHKVANGASDLLKDIFGDAGIHARAAVGAPALPLNSTVEVDVTFAL